MAKELHDLTLTEMADGLKAKRFTARDITDVFLARIKQADAKLHSYIEVYEEEAQALATAADKAREANMPRSPLHGLPIGIKDLCELEGRITTAGSKMWEKRVSTVTSATVERLLSVGMVPLGKLHMVEFAFGTWGTNPLMGTPWNPWDLQTQRVPGGSSSGSGVAVAAGLAPAAIGSDTGGSVRIPAAFNGIVGLKTTWGRISLHGTMLLSKTLDTIGPMTRSVRDAALIYDALRGPDPRDPATQGHVADDVLTHIEDGIKGWKIAVLDEAQLPDFVHADVRAGLARAAKALRDAGAVVDALRLPDWYFTLGPEVGGIISSEAFGYHRDWIEDESKPIGKFVRNRILGVKNMAPGAYGEMLQRRPARMAEFLETLRPYQALITPGTPFPALPVAEVDEGYLHCGYFTRPGNYLGLCSLSLPSGLSNGLPVGVQIIGRPFDETGILRIGRAYEKVTDFVTARPDLKAVGL
jgi:aspartyl-tRNA(Asn)/glutamyl-tRNA(Gln) amidotransferase subunit A